ncbi:PREDICTED: uncharacterized protein LOC105976794 [Erythranthe guttata]|uniref:uncharacterized protein LOC105976794 n=1 Tax=Erythranthe guttata TaxID=4155 RepID=UPI00064DBC0D|nr:PREDICTED: uncharacterized protein LOC105976794 [Erythranthe guttata]|eukprot:XP_012857508.1 PREDICTED: uncharacterized protein LOC105976794 [Erythranthe guttata]
METLAMQTGLELAWIGACREGNLRSSIPNSQDFSNGKEKEREARGSEKMKKADQENLTIQSFIFQIKDTQLIDPRVFFQTSCDSILVDGAVVLKDDETIISCGSEIIPGPEADGICFKVMPTKQICKKQIKITLDPEHAKCSICLNIWHDVVTIAPCLHNFCNGCFSEWLKRCQEKRSTVLCPQCRAVVQFVGRNHFLHNIEEDIQKSDPSLTRSDEEIETLDRCSSIKSCLGKCYRFHALLLQILFYFTSCIFDIVWHSVQI